MIKLKVLTTVAAIALALPSAVPSESFAQHFKGGRGGVAVGGGAGAPAARFSGGGGAPAARFSAGAAPMAHYSSPGASSMARYSGVTTGGAPAARWSGATTGTRFSTGPTVTRYSSGYGGWNGGYRYRHRGGGVFPRAGGRGAVGGALSPNLYFRAPYYYTYRSCDAFYFQRAALGGGGTCPGW